MTKKYRIDVKFPKAEIEEVEIIRETDSYVFLPTWSTKRNPSGEERALKITEWYEYHDTWEAAHAVLVCKASQQVESASRKLEIVNDIARRIGSMKKP